jgi:hypothetical protein
MPAYVRDAHTDETGVVMLIVLIMFVTGAGVYLAIDFDDDATWLTALSRFIGCVLVGWMIVGVRLTQKIVE